MFSPDQRSIQQLARDFAQSELAPVASAIEKDPMAILPIWKRMGELGFTGLSFPEAYGGADLDNTSYLLVIEELAKVSASVAVTLSVHTTVGILPIFSYGNEDQKQRYLPKLISGEHIAAFGLTEPDAGSDAASGGTKAQLDGEHYVLNGSKIFITNAHLADVFVVTARTNMADKTAKGLTAFIIDKNTPGFSIDDGDEKLGIQGSDWGCLVFDNARVPVANRLGEEGQGFKIFMSSLDSGRISIGAMALGIAEACLTDSLKYAKERKQFNQPIADFQAIQFKLSDMATDIEAARHLVFHAARLKDAGMPYAKEASMAKLWSSEVSSKAANHAIQIFGGYGYTKDFPVERYWRDAKCTEIVEGTSEVQRLVIARHLLYA